MRAIAFAILALAVVTDAGETKTPAEHYSFVGSALFLAALVCAIMGW